MNTLTKDEWANLTIQNIAKDPLILVIHIIIFVAFIILYSYTNKDTLDRSSNIHFPEKKKWTYLDINDESEQQPNECKEEAKLQRNQHIQHQQHIVSKRTSQHGNNLSFKGEAHARKTDKNKKGKNNRNEKLKHGM